MLVVLLGIAWVGCSGAGPGSDGGVDAAGQATLDAGAPDASSDAGSADSGTDAGAPDAGDAGGSDGGADAGESDAGGSDAGGPDAGSDAGAVDAGCDCGSLQCLSDGGCGECASPMDCPAGLPICDPGRSVCLCSAAPDSCPGATYCDQGTCRPGCHDGASCRSGVCTASHDCLNCQTDDECAGGRRCGTGVCSAPCQTAATCQSGELCCGDTCVDPARDVLHCGACAAPCADTQFCGRGACREVVLANVCEQPIARVMLDGVSIDDDAGLSIAQALAQGCTPMVSLRIGGQFDAGVLDLSTGEPLQVGELLVAGGGSFRQRAIAWLEFNALTPVREADDATTLTYSRRDAGVILSTPLAGLSTSHDLFVVQFVRTPYGATVLNASGYYAAGTAAASWYVVNTLLPQRATLTVGWYLVDWVDTNANQLPDAADTWTVMASGL